MKLIIITSDHKIENEALLINELFANGLMLLHLRKPDYSLIAYSLLISEIDKEYHDRVVLHQHHPLALKYALKGIHLTESKRKEVTVTEYLTEYKKQGITHFSTSCHQIKTINVLDFDYTYVFLSPVFDAISKSNYEGKAFDVKALSGNVIALGGITPTNIVKAKQLGYNGVAVLGFIWNSNNVVESLTQLIKSSNHE